MEKPNSIGLKQPWRLLLVLLLGQLASLLAAVSTFSSSYIADLGVDTPLTQCLLTYLSMAVFYGSILLHRRQKLMVPWYWYIVLAFIDVQGNYMVTKAYQYSPITSVVLLYSWVVPWAILLTWLILRTRYSPRQFFGATICVIGFILVLLFKASSGGGKNPLLGNTLVVAGTLCCTLSMVGEEFCVKKKDRVEVVAMLGVFGALVCACQISIFERKDLASVKWSPLMVALFAGYAGASFLIYTLTPFILKMSGATLLYLSLLTCNMWAVLIRIFFYREQIHWLYYLAFAIVAVGLVIYSSNYYGCEKRGRCALHFRVLIREKMVVGPARQSLFAQRCAKKKKQLHFPPPQTHIRDTAAANIVDAEATIQYEHLPEEAPSGSLTA